MIGSQIREYRQARKLSQSNIAQLIGVPQSTLSDIENNRYEPKISLASRIAEVLGVTLEALLNREVKS